jgi:signal transduction histidine kinase
VISAAAGQSLPATQTKSTALTAVSDLHSALADLTARDRNLRAASEMELNDNYREYLKLMQDSNDKLTETVNAALQILALLEKEQYSLGWDEIGTQVIVSHIFFMQDRVEQLNDEAEILRTRAEQIRKDNPKDFGD